MSPLYKHQFAKRYKVSELLFSLFSAAIYMKRLVWPVPYGFVLCHYTQWPTIRMLEYPCIAHCGKEVFAGENKTHIPYDVLDTRRYQTGGYF